MSASKHDVTELLHAWSAGDLGARDRLMPLVYQDLRRRAAAQLRRERQDHTLQPTALVHEAYLRLVDQRRAVWQNRAQFLAIASQIMRRLLVDRERERRTAKRAGGWVRVSFDDAAVTTPAADLDVLALDTARLVTDLFHAALARSSEDERAAFLGDACAGDGDLRAEVDDMLAAHREAGSFGEAPAFARADAAPPVELDSYRILRRIGEGGMGVVYEAEQHRPVRRKVALKLIRAGFDTEQALLRFQSERQALALMNHPSIASVFEAGTTRDGTPYFAMELVPGSPVTELCDQHRLSIRARLELFIQICEGVQHAHQKGVIHRDLKPSNILVAMTERGPIPKIIDFGVAKATSSALGESAPTTLSGMLVGTLAYMSPEQAEMANQDVDTRTDVYSLGVVLYEMLVGALPYGVDEIRRRVVDGDPVPPSSKAPADLVRQLRGDLDWIVLKALARDRSRRYETASALALDVRRHLEDRPIQARAPSLGYALGKLVRRHRMAVVAGLLVLAALVVGSIVATVGLIRARTAEAKARVSAAKAVAVNAFLLETLAAADPLSGRERDLTVHEAIASAGRKAEDALRDQPEILGAVLNTLGRSHLGLGSWKDAEPILRRALEIRRGPGIPPRDLGEALTSLGTLLFETGKYADAEPLFREALALYRALGDADLLVSESLNDLAMTLGRKDGDYPAAGRLLEESLAIRTRVLGERDVAVAQSLNNLGMNDFRMGALDRAESLFRRAVVMNRELLGPEHPELSTNWHNLGLVLRDKGQFDEAERLFRRCLDFETKHFGKDHPRVGQTLQELGNLLRTSGRPSDAERCYRDELAIQTQHLPAGSWQIAATQSAIAACMIERGEYAQAEPVLLEALPILRQGVGEHHPATQATLRRLVDLYDRWRAPEKGSSYRAHLEAPR